MKFHDIERGEIPDGLGDFIVFDREGSTIGDAGMMNGRWLHEYGAVDCKQYPLWIRSSELFDILMENEQ